MQFYFTLSPSDLSRQRLLPGAHGMLVASSLWRPKTARLGYRQPPFGVLASLVLDSGGFNAARKWGQYPWSVDAYATLAQRYADGPCPLAWVAVMDYACEHGVDREQLATNQQRIAATVDNARRCREQAPTLPWLPVIQGWTLDEYAQSIDLYTQAGFPLAYAGLGTMCGRPVREACAILRALAEHYPHQRYHVFGMHLGVLDDHDAAAVVESWDSYAWDWEPNGSRGRSAWKRRRGGLPDWTYSKEVRARAQAYSLRVRQAITQPRTLPLFGAQNTPPPIWRLWEPPADECTHVGQPVGGDVEEATEHKTP